MDTSEAKNDLEMLAWQVAMGVDETVGDDLADWFARSADTMAAKAAAREAPLAAPVHTPSPQQPRDLPKAHANTSVKGLGRAPSVAQPATSSQDEVADARKLAASCASIDELITALKTFDACPLSRTATNLCFIDGNRDAEIMLIGEAPGRDEDLQGKPFVGRSGQLLDKMLSHIDLSRDNEKPEKSVLISNTVFWRPPGNRKPTEAETLMCLPFVSKLIELVAPKFIVCLGAIPTQRLTGETKGITRLRGRWFTYPAGHKTPNDNAEATSIPLLATLHPSYLLRQPMQKKLAWRDFLALKLKTTELN